jgi:hypothetical protein
MRRLLIILGLVCGTGSAATIARVEVGGLVTTDPLVAARSQDVGAHSAVASARASVSPGTGQLKARSRATGFNNIVEGSTTIYPVTEAQAFAGIEDVLNLGSGGQTLGVQLDWSSLQAAASSIGWPGRFGSASIFLNLLLYVPNPRGLDFPPITLVDLEMSASEDDLDGFEWYIRENGVFVQSGSSPIGSLSRTINVPVSDFFPLTNVNLSYSLSTEAYCDAGEPFSSPTCSASANAFDTASLRIDGSYTSRQGYSYLGSDTSVSGVPEPGTWTLMGGALLLAVAKRCLRRRV